MADVAAEFRLPHLRATRQRRTFPGPGWSQPVPRCALLRPCCNVALGISPNADRHESTSGSKSWMQMNTRCMWEGPRQQALGLIGAKRLTGGSVLRADRRQTERPGIVVKHPRRSVPQGFAPAQCGQHRRSCRPRRRVRMLVRHAPLIRGCAVPALLLRGDGGTPR